MTRRNQNRQHWVTPQGVNTTHFLVHFCPKRRKMMRKEEKHLKMVLKKSILASWSKCTTSNPSSFGQARKTSIRESVMVKYSGNPNTEHSKTGHIRKPDILTSGSTIRKPNHLMIGLLQPSDPHCNLISVSKPVSMNDLG